MEQKLDYHMGEMVMNKLISVPYYYYEIPSFYNHQFRIRNNYGTRFLRPIKNTLEILQNCITIVSYIGFLFFTHWALVIMGIIVAIPTFIIQYKYGQSKFHLFKDQSGNLREAQYLTSLFGDKQSTKEIRLFSLQDTLLEKWRNIVLNNNKQLIGILNKQKNANIGLDSFSALLLAGAAVLTVYILKIKKLSIGSFVTTIQSLKDLQYSVNNTSFILAVILESSLYIKDFFEFLDYEDNRSIRNQIKPNLKTNLDFPNSFGNISIENLYYKYPMSESYTLKGISLNIKEREKVAIVGDNGSGKSTLIKILVGLYQPTKGNVFFSDREIRNIKDDDLRRNLTVIFQDFVRFAYSVKENIAFSNIADLDNDEKINEIANISGVKDLINKLPQGYETNLGKILPNSVDISGGEWQKIALSRALFKDSNIVILDEPTASLDPQSELDIFNKFLDLVSDKTAIFISHRMASARMADRIIVLKNGEIVEEGSHVELMIRRKFYYEMYEAQATWYQEQ